MNGPRADRQGTGWHSRCNKHEAEMDATSPTPKENPMRYLAAMIFVAYALLVSVPV